MSFLTDIFHGNFSNLGHDLAPSNIFSDFGTDATKVLSNPLADVGIAAGIALPFLAPEIGTALGIGGAATGATGAAAEGGLSTALDFAAPAATAADTAGVSAIDTALAGGAADFATLGPGLATAASAPLDITASSPSFLSSLISGAETSLTKNPLGIALAAGGLGYDVLAGNKTDPNQAALQTAAGNLQAQGGALSASGQQLQTYLTSGTLPPALQAQVSQAVAAEKARIIANAAHNGQNTDPAQNSALAAELSQAEQNGLIMGGQLEQQLFQSGTQLLQTGVNETGLSTNIYQALVNMDRQNNTQVMTAIGNMAAALGGGSKISLGGGTTGVTINTSG